MVDNLVEGEEVPFEGGSAGGGGDVGPVLKGRSVVVLVVELDRDKVVSICLGSHIGNLYI